MKRFSKIFKKEDWLTVLISAAVMTGILMNLEFNLLEATLYDFRMAKGPDAPSSKNIALVTIDEATTKELNEFSPLSFEFHAKFLESLESYHPKGVGYLVDMSHVSESSNESSHGPSAYRFVEAAKRLEAKGSSFIFGTLYDVNGEVVPAFPLSLLSHSVALIHKDGNVFSEDKVTRRALTRLYAKPVFHLEFAQKLHLISQDFKPRGEFYVPEADASYVFLKYRGNTAMPRNKPEEIPYARYSFSDVLNHRVSEDALKDKIVLVGTMIREDSRDFAFTPYARNTLQSPKLVIHATILDSLLHNDNMLRVPNWINWATTFILSALVISWVLSLTPLYGVALSLGLAIAFCILSQALFSFEDLWLRASQPLVGVFLSYYLAVPFRLIREYKKRWDYQRKHQLLVEVEELKTNFLRLVTHDLKTPVARIQGLAEVILRKNTGHLLTQDVNSLNSIIDSTDELNRFVTSILDITKVESNRIHLNLESKDINQLIEKCVENFKAQARTKKVQITTQLEPLFPIKIDTSLISKVLNNLIDNAIKYSPEGSQVTIESREKGDWIEVSVIDQGIGLNTEELSHLFKKFYRAKNVATQKIKGTGLGLYLTKYFIEAHHGQVLVESKENVGSVFKILLAIDIQKQVPGLKTAQNEEKRYVQSTRS